MGKLKNSNPDRAMLFRKMILTLLKDPRPIYVNCNDVGTILKEALKAAGDVKSHDVYYQPNTHFSSHLEISELTTFDYYKEKFQAYRDYFDKFNEKQILGGIKKLYNYSKDQDKVVYAEYPTDVKMILVVENFNFYDLNSQYILAELSEDHKNILMIGQVRSDFEFAKNHIDIGIKAGKGGGIFLDLD
jgi:hypothetical protein